MALAPCRNENAYVEEWEYAKPLSNKICLNLDFVSDLCGCAKFPQGERGAQRDR